VPASASATGPGERLAGDSHSGDSCGNQRNRKERLIALGHRISPCVFRRSGHRFVASGNLKFAAPGRCDGHHNFADFAFRGAAAKKDMDGRNNKPGHDAEVMLILSEWVMAAGKTFVCEFPLTKGGTFMYHPHSDEIVQMAMGMMGMFLVHPRDPALHRVDRDFAFIMSPCRIERQTIPTRSHNLRGVQ
jgi:hypothetical protein